MSDRRLRAKELGLELMEPMPHISGMPHVYRREVGDVLAKLGYPHLRDTCATEHPKASDLLAVLYDVDDAPFTRTSVEQYKEKKLKELNVAPWEQIFFENGFQASFLIMLMLSLVATVFHISGAEFIAEIIVAVSTAALVLTGIFLLVLYARRREALWHNYSWQRLPLEKYSEQLPFDVAERIAKIHRSLPCAEFKVDHLVCERRNPDPDPFLIVCYGGQEFYIAVWDEPDFDGKLLA
jgi:hypothetical protein